MLGLVMHMPAHMSMDMSITDMYTHVLRGQGMIEEKKDWFLSVWNTMSFTSNGILITGV